MDGIWRASTQKNTYRFRVPESNIIPRRTTLLIAKALRIAHAEYLPNPMSDDDIFQISRS